MKNLSLIGALLVGTIGLSACNESTSGNSETPSAPNYQTQSEEGAAVLGACIDDLGNDACLPVALALCETIKQEAFNNPYSEGTTLRNFTTGNAETKETFRLSTANSFMKRAGYGEICK